MRVEPLFRVLLSGGWPAAWHRYPEYFAGLIETYGTEIFGPGGPAAAWTGQLAAPVLSHLQRVAHLDWEGQATTLLRQAYHHLPGPPAPLYLGTLLGLAPAATLAVQGRPALAVGLERFDPAALAGPPPRLLYQPGELAEIIPHEAAHAVRFQALGLPPTPRLLSLAEMLLLEGTAVLFTDWLLGKETVRSLLPPAQLASLRSREPYLLAGVAQELHLWGMPAFQRYFSAAAPVSGYYLGWALARRYQAATSQAPVSVLLTPTDRILATVMAGGTAGPAPAVPASSLRR